MHEITISSFVYHYKLHIHTKTCKWKSILISSSEITLNSIAPMKLPPSITIIPSKPHSITASNISSPSDKISSTPKNPTSSSMLSTSTLNKSRMILNRITPTIPSKLNNPIILTILTNQDNDSTMNHKPAKYARSNSYHI